MNGGAKGSWFRRYLVPGLVFKAAVIGPAYSTGRELAEFFGPHGPWGGLLGMAVAMLMWSATFAVSLEFARLTRSYDYKSFFSRLVGRASIVTEVLMILLALLIVSVIGATTGELLDDLLGIGFSNGVAVLAIAVLVLTVVGHKRIEAFLSGWSLVLYSSYAVFLVLALITFGDRIALAFGEGAMRDPASAAIDGMRYGGYNIAAIAMVLFTARNVESRKDALIAGALGGPLAMLPGILFFVAMMGHPQAIAEVLPVNYMLARIGIPILPMVYGFIIVVTLASVAATVLHSLNERVVVGLEARGLRPSMKIRLFSTILIMAVGFFGSAFFGLVQLVGSGYGLIAFGFVAFFVVPVLTVGLWRIIRSGPAGAMPAQQQGVAQP